MFTATLAEASSVQFSARRDQLGPIHNSTNDNLLVFHLIKPKYLTKMNMKDESGLSQQFVYGIVVDSRP